MNDAGKFLRSVVHTRPRQLLRRLRRLVWQRWYDALGHRVANRLRRPAPEVSGSAPEPVFPPRFERVEAGPDGLCARLLNVRWPLASPIQWKPAGPVPELLRFGVHYMEYLEALDQPVFERTIEDWIDHNPLHEPGAWRIAWNSYVLSLRVVVWMQELARRRERLDPTFLVVAHASLAEQLRFLERHLELDLGGNHLIKDAKALLWASRYFAGPQAERWGALGERWIEREIGEQILADGLHYERSPAYHAQVFADLCECALVAGQGLRRRLMAVLAPMAQALVDLTHPDGGVSLLNDGGLSMAYSTAQCLGVYERLGGRKPAPRALFALSHAGYFGLRRGESLFIADCAAIGPDHLPAHGHGDLLSFEWTVAGRRIIVDAGVYEYERGPRRDAARSTLAHNTVTVAGLDQCEFWANFRVGRRAHARVQRYEARTNGFLLEGSHDGYRHLPGAPRHRRHLQIDEEHLNVEDEIEGGAGQKVEARLLLHPDVRLERRGSAWRLACGEAALVLETPHPAEAIEARWWPDFGVEVPTRQLVLHYGPAPCRGSFRLQRVTTPSASAMHPAIPGFQRPQ